MKTGMAFQKGGRLLALLAGVSPHFVRAAPATGGVDYFSGIGALLGIVLLIFLMAWLLKKTRLVSPVGGQIQLITSLPLGARERLTVVQVGDEQFLLGITASQITLLSKLDTPLSRVTGASGFSQQLAQMMKKHEK